VSLPVITIHTDGGCDPNPGRGAWAAIIQQDGRIIEISGCEADTTNNRMELTAAIRALKSLKIPSIVQLHTDSTYLKRGMTEWMPAWLARNWRGASGPVANQDLWKELLSAAKPHQVTWKWVRGHAGNRFNIRVDALVHQARRK